MVYVAVAIVKYTVVFSAQQIVRIGAELALEGRRAEEYASLCCRTRKNACSRRSPAVEKEVLCARADREPTENNKRLSYIDGIGLRRMANHVGLELPSHT